MKHALKAGLLSILGILFLVADAAHAQTTEVNARSAQAVASNAAAIPGRVSSDQLKAILAAADDESRRAFSDLVEKTAALPAALLSVQELLRHRTYVNPCIQKIVSIQSRLGKSLQPKQVEDIVAMNQLLSRRDGDEFNVCRGVFQSTTNLDLFGIFTSVSAAIDVEKQRQQQIESAKNAILQVEAALDAGDLIRANQFFQGPARIPSLPPFAQSYLQQTQCLRQDLDTYSQAVAIDQLQSVSLLDQLQKLNREVSLLHQSASGRPLTQAYLQHAIKDGIDASRRQLANLPTLQFNEATYRIPTTISERDELTSISNDIKAIDESLAKVSEVQAVIAQPEAIQTIGEFVGGSEAANFKATADQIAAAERTRASLVDAQNSVQAKITAKNKIREEAEQKRLATAEAARQAAARKEAAADALNFVNRRFVASYCSSPVGGRQLCSRNAVLSVAGDKLVMDEDFEDHYANGSVQKSHETMTVSITDLDARSVVVQDNEFKTTADSIEVSCKRKANCVKAIGTSADGKTEQYPNHVTLTVGHFSRTDANEVGSYLKRLLEAQQGKSPSVIEHEPNEEEALAFLQAHFVKTLNMGKGVTAVHRTLSVEDDDLVLAQDLLQYAGGADRLVVRVSLGDLNELMIPTDGGIGLVCKASSGGVPNCFSASTGQSSSNLVLMGVSSREQFASMLKRLIVLHQQWSRTQR